MSTTDSLKTFFGPNEGGYFKCLADGCDTSIKQQKSSNASLVKHLKRRHRTLYEEYLCLRSSSSRSDNAGSLLSYEGFTKSNSLLMDDLFATFCLTSCTPLVVVQNEYLAKFVRKLCTGSFSKYSLPSYDALRETIVPNMFERVKNNVKLSLQSAESVAVSVDIWTDSSRRSFLCITAHWISSNWTSRDALLCLKRLKGSHTGATIQEKCKCTFQVKNIQIFWYFL